jgi:O-antigen/teichoic acid export membrane protein
LTNLESTKRIAKNTGMLYFRMMLTIAVSLYTARILLNTLGIEDFGIYNVVGGVVMLISFLNSSMASATQRFISFELGIKNFERLRDIFSMSVNIHLLISLTIFVLAETIGLWFLNAYLVIPSDRIEAANWVYQFTILSFVLTVINVPYNALIIAHERMSIYAYVGIVEVILKLFVVFSLSWFGIDKLKLYGILGFIVSGLIWLINRFFCIRYFTEIKYRFFWDKTLFKTLMSYSGWNLFGNIAGVAMGQGVNILLNIFFNPVVNAARAIAYQVNGAVNGFVNSFQIAINPQIVKSFAVKDLYYMHQLIYKGSKYSFFLLFIISLPLLLETKVILNLWLKNVPEFTELFCQLVLINALVDSISGPLITAAQATGEIKKYQVIIGVLLLMNLPISYISLKFGMPPQTTMYVSVVISLIALYLRLYILKSLIFISINKFLKEVLLQIFFIGFCSLVIPALIKYYLEPSIIRLFLVSTTAIIFSIIFIFLIGINHDEKKGLYLRITYLFRRR